MSLKLPQKVSADFSIENNIGGLVCGLDEVGRGPLAGPVVAACVYIPPEIREFGFIGDIKDSKKLSRPKLEILYAQITHHCVYGIAEVSPQEIDDINILQASLKAMALALKNSGMDFAHALVDGNKLPKLPCPATAVVKGDSKSKSIAAASIIAKVTRDRLMEKLSAEHPYYGWERNVGYPTREHVEALEIHGITLHHRKSFGPVARILEKKITISA